MNYPIWHIPDIGGAWLIGIIACIHIFISHFAVGGGIFFAVTEQIAKNNNDSRLYDYLKDHSKFFLLLTTVAGAVTGVAIWWAISLVNPDGTHTLIQNYTLGWATEYLFFVAELATIFVYYYTWDKISKEQHLVLARFYAIFSVLTLVIINGILTFMLTPGGWLESEYWGHGFFNPTYWPSLILRLLVMVALAGMYALVTSAMLPKDSEKDLDFRTYMLRYSSKWFLPIFFLGPLVGYWFYANIPAPVVESIFAGIQSSGVGNFSIMARALYLSLILSGTILVFVFVGPYLNPRGFSVYNALLFLACGLLVTSIGEWSREMLRKPYVIYNYIYSNGILKKDVARLQEEGFLVNSKWAAKDVKLFIANDGKLSPELLADSEDMLLRAGETIFRQQCMSCHTMNGYRSIKRLIGERNEAAISGFLTMLRETDAEKNPYLGIMPPLATNQMETKALSKYLASLNSH